MKRKLPKDKRGMTGEKNLENISREALLYCLFPEDYQETVNTVKEIIRTGSNSEKLTAVKLIWEYTIPKPSQSVDMTSKGGRIEGVIVKFVEPGAK